MADGGKTGLVVNDAENPRTFVSRTLRMHIGALAGQQFGGERDMYEVLGYPRIIGPAEYRQTYDRGDVAGRIVDAYPEATWREPPTIRPKGADGKPVEGSGFEKEVEQLAEKLNLWGTLTRLDRLTGLGHYGVLMLGLNGAEDTALPALQKPYGLFYLTPHGETSAQVTNWDTDPRSPRYGKPLMYRLTIGPGWTGLGGNERSIACHWSRTVHVAERAMEDVSVGQPRLQRLFNRLMDWEKLLGGGAEIFWQNAAQLRAWIADPEAEWSPDDRAAIKEQLEEFRHRIRRDVQLQGVKPESLASDAQSLNAAALADKVLDALAGSSGIPKRILMGTERGELSSEQDENNWAARIKERREQHATPNMMRPFIDRCIALGVLSSPGQYGYAVVWPKTDTLGEEKRATVAKTKAEAVAAYVGTPGADMVMPVEEFRIALGESPTSEYQTAQDMEDSILTPKTPPALGGPPGAGADVDETAEAVAAFNRRLVLIDNAAPRTLYVRRQVLNWRAIAAWAKAQGFTSTLGEAMHVTVAFSRTPVDWMKVSQEWAQKPGDLSGTLEIAAGGARVVEGLGEKGAVVLQFRSNELEWRHEAIKAAGASWDFPGYQPHITLTYQPGAVKVAEVTPYAGEIILGPELFEPLDDDWVKGVRETPVAA
jgi:hypothetical protein